MLALRRILDTSVLQHTKYTYATQENHGQAFRQIGNIYVRQTKFLGQTPDQIDLIASSPTKNIQCTCVMNFFECCKRNDKDNVYLSFGEGYKSSHKFCVVHVKLGNQCSCVFRIYTYVINVRWTCNAAYKVKIRYFYIMCTGAIKI